MTDRWYKDHLITRSHNGWWHVYCDTAPAGRLMADTLGGLKEDLRQVECQGCGHSL